jgi:hypothetical protein
MTKSTKYQTIEEILEFAKSATKGDQIDSRTRKEFLDQANLKVIDGEGNNILHRANDISKTDPQVYHFLREVLQIKGIDLDRQNNKLGGNEGINPTLQRRSLVAQSEEKISNFKNFFKDVNYPSPSPRDPDLSTQSKAR